MNSSINKKAYINTFVANIFIQICTVLQGVLLARFLGPIGRGEFAAVILWPSMFAGIGILGINIAIARYAGKGEQAGKLVRTAIFAGLITGTVTTLLCAILLPTLIPEDKHELLRPAYFFLLFIPLNHIGLNLMAVDHGRGDFVGLNISRTIMYPIFFIGLLACWIFAQEKIFWVVGALLFANASVVVFRLMMKSKSICSLSTSVIRPKLLLKASLPFILVSVIAVLYAQLDKALLIWLSSPQEIGWYVAAFAAAGSVNILSSALGIVQFSSAARAMHGKGFNHLASVLRRCAMVSIIGGGFLFPLLPLLVPLVYGSAFKGAIPIAQVLLPGMILAGLSEIINQALCGQGKPLLGIFSRVLGLMVMGLVGLWLYKIIGSQGIAVAFFASELFVFFGLLIVANIHYEDATWGVLKPVSGDLKFLFEQINRFKKR
jgi:enterobacterial common antigen flippase